MSDIPPTCPIRLSDAARDAAEAALRAVTETELGEAVPDTCVRPYLEHGAKHLRNHLPCEVLEALADWRHAATPWLNLTNLPEPDRRVPTPQDGFTDEEALQVPNLVQFGLLHLLGMTPVAYVWENAGRLIRNVAPHPDAARTRTSWGHARHLGWHTDDSVLDHRAGAAASMAIPHFLSFYGIRNSEGVPTELLPLDTVVAALPAQVAVELRRPQFAVGAPESYTGGTGSGEPPQRTDVPVLWTLPDGNDALRYAPGRVTGQTAWARAALRSFEECVAGLAGVPVTVEAGGFHIFDNRRVLHRRVSFAPAPPGRARWLRRCYAMRRAAAR
ncbi:TauD/TfdA family dioxygenase [Streptomyces sp. NPDC048639]|uniref:TauD/TfdA family dioxygenase n=1 Tax=Streptomyces sp. NPDC048639 TaxID=3365581 RepID=UPI0037167A32